MNLKKLFFYPAFLILPTFVFINTPALANLPISVNDEKLPSLAPMVENVSPSVVNIFTKSKIQVSDNPLFNDPFFRQFFGDLTPNQPRQKESQSLGTGVIIDSTKGYIVTNNHVVEKADEISVQLEDGRQFDAKLVGGDSKADVAVIQIQNADNLTAISMGDSEKLRVGDFVVAIGNPFGLGHTVTSGIVSALGRSGLNIEEYENFIQTDASINPGNSGGALVDLNGNLVGINTAIIGRQGNVGIGFAIPINMVQVLTDQLVEYGEVKRGQLGVYIQDLNPQLADALNINIQKGAVITEVIPGTAADKGGLLAGDVVTRLNNKQINSMSDLRNYVGLIRDGEKVDVEFLRDGKSKSIELKISSQVETASINSNSSVSNTTLRGASLIEVDELSGISIVVKDVEVGSASAKSGLIAGDKIVAIDRKKISSIKDVRNILSKINGAILVNIKRNGAPRFIVIQ